ncbi:hypothetical protein [Haladaptatus sp. DYF46]|uniref:hypothetical protein n=1 Tax=Haladaptatus sp. DYF46 TaxID=2886041 RepID=UPI001E38F106|nr:hypothetical protein [Haladaptatus sp. DYF46]
MSSDITSSDGLLSRFRNVRAAFPEQVVARPTSSVFHRLDLTVEDSKRPACSAGKRNLEWHVADPDTVRLSGLRPCRSCFQGILEYLAQQPDSPVEARVSTEDTFDSRESREQSDEDVFEPIATPLIPSITSLTDEVMITSGSSKIMHAPTTDGPLCRQRGEYRIVEPSVLGGQYRPCGDCFENLPE